MTLPGVKAATVAIAVTVCMALGLCLTMTVQPAHAAAAKPAKVKAVKVDAKSSSSVKVTWSKVKKAKGYQVRVSTKKTMKSAKKITVKGYKTTAKTVKGLKNHTTYYVQVRAYKVVKGKKIYGAWSAKKSKTTLCSHPSKKTTVTKVATCTAEGLQTTSCAVCGKVTATSGIKALGHTKTTTVTEPTCTKPGTSVITCKVCGMFFSVEVLDRLGHNWAAATCTDPKSCERCGATEGEALGHTGGTATCTEAAICERCNEPYGEALDHDWAAATCTDPKTCKRCKTTEGEALGHTGGTATCTQPKVCDRCQEAYSPALGHDYEWGISTSGLFSATCSRCQDHFNGQGADKVRNSLAEYTWPEIKAIANAISATPNEDAAVAVAEAFNLVGSDGKLTGNETKSVAVGELGTFDVQILGFYHDDKVDGSGKAGITFGFKDIVTKRFVNIDADDENNGGWAASRVKAYLDSTFLNELPEDLKNQIESVSKMANNTGRTANPSDIVATEGKVWLLSAIEAYGDFDTSNPVFSAEGYQYKLYADNEVTKQNYSFLIKQHFEAAGTWWTRSPNAAGSAWFFVNSSGGLNSELPTTYAIEGVAPCFCL